MRLPSSFRRRDDAASSAAAAPEDVAVIRQRAKRRLIGASLLLAIGVIGFPLLFETQPRPIPVDIAIEIPRKDNAAPLVLPSKRDVPATVVLPAEPAEAEAALVVPPKPAASVAAVATRPASAGTTKAAVAASAVDVEPGGRKDIAAASPSTPVRGRAEAGRSDDGRRAQALLDGQPAPPAAPASEAGAVRVVVQVGAYTDVERLRAARQKVEQLGMKTYVQVVEAEGTSRTRVRVGPFASRHEAEQAAARIRAAGLPAAILVL